jgi:hypothetical protein
MEQPNNTVQGTEADPARISTGSAGLEFGILFVSRQPL